VKETKILGEVRAFAKGKLAAEIPGTFHYHNLGHTQEVVEAAEEIASAENVSNEDLEILLLAAWFHDTGYTQTYDEHEAESAAIADRFLSEKGFPETRKKEVIQLILATKYPPNPESLLEEIICDADTYSLGTADYMDKNQKIRQEWLEVHGSEYEDREWLEMSIAFLQKHRYFTDFAKRNLEDGKLRNIKNLREKLS
jgi:predicted metal-dependent HD superfamily phosphohydrolase